MRWQTWVNITIGGVLEIVFTHAARESFRRIRRERRVEIGARLLALAAAPSADVKPLTDRGDEQRPRVGRYRVIFR